MISVGDWESLHKTRVCQLLLFFHQSECQILKAVSYAIFSRSGKAADELEEKGWQEVAFIAKGLNELKPGERLCRTSLALLRPVGQFCSIHHLLSLVPSPLFEQLRCFIASLLCIVSDQSLTFCPPSEQLYLERASSCILNLRWGRGEVSQLPVPFVSHVLGPRVCICTGKSPPPSLCSNSLRRVLLKMPAMGCCKSSLKSTVREYLTHLPNTRLQARVCRIANVHKPSPQATL